LLQSPPTVILDEPCAILREAVAAFAPVFVFRRRGGFLATPPGAAAEELHDALAAANLTPPYVLVAASFGGFTALAYAARYPASLTGMVLVDSSHPEQSAAVSAAIPPAELLIPAVAAFKQYLQGFGPVWTEGCAAIAGIRNLGNVPMTVLAAGRPDLPAEMSEGTRKALTEGWHALQRQHAAISPRGELRIVPGAGHNIVAAAPEAILAAIQEQVARGSVI
jgi:pimeloyl-ACP methyl ester carboxylesterase